MYNMFQRNKVDVLLAQETFLDEQTSLFFESNFPLVSITSIRNETSRGVSIIINTRTTEWIPATPNSDSPILFADEEARLLVCKICVRGMPLTVANIYAPADNTQKIPWFTATTENIRSSSLPLPCDIIGGNFNHSITRRDRRTGVSPSSSIVDASLELLRVLGKDECDYIDNWRSHNPRTIAFTFYRQKKGVSRINRIYVRSERLAECTEWKISSHSLPTDHKAVSMVLEITTPSTRGPGRWRLNPILLKLREVRETCRKALTTLSGQDPLQEWVQYKQEIGTFLREVSSSSRRKHTKLRLNLERRKERLWNQRRPQVNNLALEMKIEAVEVQEQCLADWYNRSYAYNAMAKHFLLNEKPTKWFFSRVRQDTYQSINALEDEQGTKISSPKGLLDITTRFYGDLYSEKPSDKEARKEILRYLTTKISDEAMGSLTAPITAREIKLSHLRKQRPFRKLNHLCNQNLPHNQTLRRKQRRLYNLVQPQDQNPLRNLPPLCNQSLLRKRRQLQNQPLLCSLHPPHKQDHLQNQPPLLPLHQFDVRIRPREHRPRNPCLHQSRRMRNWLRAKSSPSLISNRRKPQLSKIRIPIQPLC